MSKVTTTHLKVPTTRRDECLGPDGSAAHVGRVFRMLQGRWKLPILFRLYADTTLRTLELKRSLAGISQKMLTQHLRELQADGLIHRMELPGTVRGVAYALTEMGQGLVPVLTSAREFSIRFAARHATVTRSARSEAGSRQHR